MQVCMKCGCAYHEPVAVCSNDPLTEVVEDDLVMRRVPCGGRQWMYPPSADVVAALEAEAKAAEVSTDAKASVESKQDDRGQRRK